MLEAFLDGEDTAVTKSEMKDRILTDEEAESISKMEDSYFGGNYPIEDKTAGQAQETDVAATPSPSALDFDELRIIALLSKHGDHLTKVTAKFPDFIDCLEKNMLSNEHIQDLEQFHKAMLLDEKLRNEYRSIR